MAASKRALRIALVGTRGVPAQYGGFETAVEEVGRRLAARGHEVTVYCRKPPPSNDGESAAQKPLTEYLGMRLVQLPALRSRSLETLSHTAISSAHMLVSRRHDVAVLFNAANAPFLPVLHLRRLPVATHVDGLEWRRAKWGGTGQRYYRVAEALSVRWSEALIADAEGIASYYREEFGAGTDLIAYGAPILTDAATDRLGALDVRPGEFHLVVARFEPENHVDIAVDGYLRSSAKHPLIVVGAAPYSAEYTARIRALAERDKRVRLVGAIWDQQQLDQLYAHALTYVHGHSVGGTNPSLLRAIGAGTAVLAYDVNFNREVLGDDGRFFSDAASLAPLFDDAEARPDDVAERGARLQDAARTRYRWDDVALAYEQLCLRLAAGKRRWGRAGRPSGRRASGRPTDGERSADRSVVRET